MSAPTKKLEPAGIQWCGRFLPSKLVADLTPYFAKKVGAMLDALTMGGANYVISDTWRPAERAYLMHWCCMVALSGQDPAEVPAMAGVAIDWSAGGNTRLAKAMALEMVRGYNITFPAALVSRHTQRRAIDMNIHMPARPAAPYKFTGGDGKVWLIAPDDKESLYGFGASFGVIKLKSDSPHWSDDGH